MARTVVASRVPFGNPPSEDELPELSELFDQLKVPDNLTLKTKNKLDPASTPNLKGKIVPGQGGALSKGNPLRRRRLGLGLVSDGTLLSPWTGSGEPAVDFDSGLLKPEVSKGKVRPQRRARQAIRSLRDQASEDEEGKDSNEGGTKGIGKDEPKSVPGQEAAGQDSDDEDESEGYTEPKLPSRSRRRRYVVSDDSSSDEWQDDDEGASGSDYCSGDEESVIFVSKNRRPTVPQRSSRDIKEGRDPKARRRIQSASAPRDAIDAAPSTKEKKDGKPPDESERLQQPPAPSADLETELELESLDEFFTPPSTPPRPRLGSPKKLNKIPEAPHGPDADLFWDREFVDDWNDKHSPLKQITIPPPGPVKRTTGKQPSFQDKLNAAGTKAAASEKARKTATKASFNARKSEIATAFVKELDDTITLGKLAELTAATGGIKLDWSKKLNTTAGRAHWQRESVRKLAPDGSVASTTYKHHASIEIATKVIDDESRLLNVLAHEFCHLATFMASGIATKPHGKEFKSWAAKCTRAFADRDIVVTTTHSYEIDFKYVWECVDCTLEYKRHSKSINPDKALCGRCKGKLRQTKPVPRASAAKPSRYQEFVKEQMKLVKLENPGSPQKDVMKVIAQRWASVGGAKAVGGAKGGGEEVDDALDVQPAEVVDDGNKTKTLLAWALED